MSGGCSTAKVRGAPNRATTMMRLTIAGRRDLSCNGSILPLTHCNWQDGCVDPTRTMWTAPVPFKYAEAPRVYFSRYSPGVKSGHLAHAGPSFHSMVPRPQTKSMLVWL